MVLHQFPVGIALGVTSLVSLTRLVYHSRQDEGKIKLPSSSLLVEEGREETKDPFNVTVPEDFVNGTPIDEDKFWLKVC